MARPPSQHPTEAELAILHVLWEHGPCRLSQIRECLSPQRELAPSTIATTLGIMFRKKLVQRQKRKGVITWRALVDRAAASDDMLNNLIDRIFDGSAKNLMAHLIEQKHLNASDHHAIRQLLKDAQNNQPRQS